MTNDNEITTKYSPEFIYIKCSNCNGYGAIGRSPRIACPSCKGKGVLKVPVKKGEEK